MTHILFYHSMDTTTTRYVIYHCVDHIEASYSLILSVC